MTDELAAQLGPPIRRRILRQAEVAEIDRLILYLQERRAALVTEIEAQEMDTLDRLVEAFRLASEKFDS